jgi:cytochrome b subunit of formate dehydrogenase
MLLTLLLFDGLAEHMLLELAACMNAEFWDKSMWSEQDIEWMKGSIITLMEAAGEPVGKHHN